MKKFEDSKNDHEEIVQAVLPRTTYLLVGVQITGKERVS
jgi:hypothetical protein